MIGAHWLPCVAVHALERARVGLGERLGIIGLGPIGLLILQVAKAAGAIEVYGVDPSPVRRRAALDHRHIGPVCAVDVAIADGDHEEDDAELDRRENRVGHGALADADDQDVGHRGHDQHRRDIHCEAAAGVVERIGRPPRRELHPGYVM